MCLFFFKSSGDLETFLLSGIWFYKHGLAVLMLFPNDGFNKWNMDCLPSRMLTNMMNGFLIMKLICKNDEKLIFIKLTNKYYYM